MDMSASLTSGERARVHQIAGALGLEHQSFGEGGARHIRVTKSSVAHLAVGGSGATAMGAGSRDMPCDQGSDDMMLDEHACSSGALHHQGDALAAGEAFGMLRLVGGYGKRAGADVHARGARGGCGVEMVLLPYNFTKLTALIEHHFAEAHTLKAAAPGKQSSGAAAVAAAAFKADMLEYYRCIPVCYLRPLRAVVRKANTSAPVQIAMPEFREQQAEENSKGAENSKAATAALLPVVSLPPSLKARMEHVRLEKGRLFDKSLAPQATVSQGLDETMEVEGKQGSSVRRARGGTPALFESLAGPLGNYAGADTRSNKAALMVNPFNIPRGNLLVHVRRMRLAFLGHEHAGPMDKRPDSRHDRSTHRSARLHRHHPPLDPMPCIHFFVSHTLHSFLSLPASVWLVMWRVLRHHLPKTFARLPATCGRAP